VSNVEIAAELLEKISDAFPNLYCRADASQGPIDFSASFPAQADLRFPVHITVDGDSLGLSVGGAFHADFFPLSDPRVVERVQEYIVGLFAGIYRVVEYKDSHNRPYRADLQRPTSKGWETRATWKRLHWPLLRYTRSFLCNAS
jgi:hypothetical protein